MLDFSATDQNKGEKGVIKFMAKSTLILGRMPEGHCLGNSFCYNQGFREY